MPITPAALLTLREPHSEACVEEFTEEDLLSYGTKRWRRAQFIAETFWQRWKTYYLQEVQVRNKWRKKKYQLKKGDLILLKRKNEPRNSWPLARIEEPKVSADGLVRSAQIKCKGKMFNRAVTDMVFIMST